MITSYPPLCGRPKMGGPPRTAAVAPPKCDRRPFYGCGDEVDSLPVFREQKIEVEVGEELKTFLRKLAWCRVK